MVVTTLPTPHGTVAELVNDAEHAHPVIYGTVWLAAAVWYGLTWWRCLPARLLVVLAVAATLTGAAGLTVGVVLR
jgi:hypothetical protein